MTSLSLEFIAKQAQEESLFIVDERQCELSRRWLWPNRDALEQDFLQLRLEFDHRFALKQKPSQHRYPIGFCREISLGVLDLLKRALNSSTTKGILALRQFCIEGGRVRRVWGDLRHSYFQNAFQVGDMYVDVANDSVVPNKPKVEILPLQKADFFPLTEYSSYAHLANNYWQAQVVPNRYLPQLAPLFPLLLVYPCGGIKLHSQYQTMFYLNLLHNYAPAEAFLLDSHWREFRLSPENLVQLRHQIERLHKKELAFSETPVSDATLSADLAATRSSSLRLDGTNLQRLLDQAHALNDW